MPKCKLTQEQCNVFSSFENAIRVLVLVLAIWLFLFHNRNCHFLGYFCCYYYRRNRLNLWAFIREQDQYYGQDCILSSLLLCLCEKKKVSKQCDFRNPSLMPKQNTSHIIHNLYSTKNKRVQRKHGTKDHFASAQPFHIPNLDIFYVGKRYWNHCMWFSTVCFRSFFFYFFVSFFFFFF